MHLILAALQLICMVQQLYRIVKVALLTLKNHLGMNQGEGKQGSSTQNNLKTSQLSPTSSIGGTTWNNPSFLNQDVT